MEIKTETSASLEACIKYIKESDEEAKRHGNHFTLEIAPAFNIVGEMSVEDALRALD